MRDLALALLIAIASYTPVAAQSMPTLPPVVFPTAGTFCGVMTLCQPKATAPKPERTVTIRD
ncbi:hypothetical protein [uncultured Tateyamaria sp.]|uniref:hypothetical protein n=1 Tax=Tateyamaria sp. 1078 TaxID=3417464 RepID=UPI0026024AAA|nr:hypothetical protein [uncultured Tateyamaria sp.]